MRKMEKTTRINSLRRKANNVEMTSYASKFKR